MDTDFAAELKAIASDLRAYVDGGAEVEHTVDAIRSAAELVGRSWSRSWLGYQANVYYGDLEPPSPGARFSGEWGLTGGFGAGSAGDWRERQPHDVRERIRLLANNLDQSAAVPYAERGRSILERAKGDALSIISIKNATGNDQFLTALALEISGLQVLSANEIARRNAPAGSLASRDMRALTEGLRVPAHVQVIAEGHSLEMPRHHAASLAEMLERAARHIQRAPSPISRNQKGTRIVIGHGRSPDWRELKDFVSERLDLEWDEFNRVSVAGIANTSRLSEMLDAAAFALLVLTGEDEQSDSRMQARQNVVHEVGLFQGRLGFNKAIVVLEEGCAEFSNIEGMGQIRFPKGNIEAAFEKVRMVLEREGLVGASSTKD